MANTVQVNAVGDEAFSQAWLWPHVRAYNEAIAKVVGKSAPSSPYFLHGSWVSGTPLGDLLNVKLFEVIIAYEESLIEELHRNAVDGSIVEFGVFQGHMLGRLLDTADRIGMRRKFFGFDSFEGLSEPSPENDYKGWEKGQYSASYDVAARHYVSPSDRTSL